MGDRAGPSNLTSIQPAAGSASSSRSRPAKKTHTKSSSKPRVPEKLQAPASEGLPSPQRCGAPLRDAPFAQLRPPLSPGERATRRADVLVPRNKAAFKSLFGRLPGQILQRSHCAEDSPRSEDAALFAKNPKQGDVYPLLGLASDGQLASTSSLDAVAVATLGGRVVVLSLGPASVSSLDDHAFGELKATLASPSTLKWGGDGLAQEVAELNGALGGLAMASWVRLTAFRPDWAQLLEVEETELPKRFDLAFLAEAVFGEPSSSFRLTAWPKAGEVSDADRARLARRAQLAVDLAALLLYHVSGSRDPAVWSSALGLSAAAEVLASRSGRAQGLHKSHHSALQRLVGSSRLELEEEVSGVGWLSPAASGRWLLSHLDESTRSALALHDALHKASRDQHSRKAFTEADRLRAAHHMAAKLVACDAKTEPPSYLLDFFGEWLSRSEADKFGSRLLKVELLFKAPWATAEMSQRFVASSLMPTEDAESELAVRLAFEELTGAVLRSWAQHFCFALRGIDAPPVKAAYPASPEAILEACRAQRSQAKPSAELPPTSLQLPYARRGGALAHSKGLPDVFEISDPPDSLGDPLGLVEELLRALQAALVQQRLKGQLYGGTIRLIQPLLNEDAPHHVARSTTSPIRFRLKRHMLPPKKSLRLLCGSTRWSLRERLPSLGAEWARAEVAWAGGKARKALLAEEESLAERLHEHHATEIDWFEARVRVLRAVPGTSRLEEVGVDGRDIHPDQDEAVEPRHEEEPSVPVFPLAEEETNSAPAQGMSASYPCPDASRELPTPQPTPSTLEQRRMAAEAAAEPFAAGLEKPGGVGRSWAQPLNGASLLAPAAPVWPPQVPSAQTPPEQVPRSTPLLATPSMPPMELGAPPSQLELPRPNDQQISLSSAICLLESLLEPKATTGGHQGAAGTANGAQVPPDSAEASSDEHQGPGWVEVLGLPSSLAADRKRSLELLAQEIFLPAGFYGDFHQLHLRIEGAGTSARCSLRALLRDASTEDVWSVLECAKALKSHPKYPNLSVRPCLTPALRDDLIREITARRAQGEPHLRIDWVGLRVWRKGETTTAIRTEKAKPKVTEKAKERPQEKAKTRRSKSPPPKRKASPEKDANDKRQASDGDRAEKRRKSQEAQVASSSQSSSGHSRSRTPPKVPKASTGSAKARADPTSKLPPSPQEHFVEFANVPGLKGSGRGGLTEGDRVSLARIRAALSNPDCLRGAVASTRQSSRLLKPLLRLTLKREEDVRSLMKEIRFLRLFHQRERQRFGFALETHTLLTAVPSCLDDQTPEDELPVDFQAAFSAAAVAATLDQPAPPGLESPRKAPEAPLRASLVLPALLPDTSRPPPSLQGTRSTAPTLPPAVPKTGPPPLMSVEPGIVPPQHISPAPPSAKKTAEPPPAKSKTKEMPQGALKTTAQLKKSQGPSPCKHPAGSSCGRCPKAHEPAAKAQARAEKPSQPAPKTGKAVSSTSKSLGPSPCKHPKGSSCGRCAKVGVKEDEVEIIDPPVRPTPEVVDLTDEAGPSEVPSPPRPTKGGSSGQPSKAQLSSAQPAGTLPKKPVEPQKASAPPSQPQKASVPTPKPPAAFAPVAAPPPAPIPTGDPPPRSSASQAPKAEPQRPPPPKVARQSQVRISFGGGGASAPQPDRRALLQSRKRVLTAVPVQAEAFDPRLHRAAPLMTREEAKRTREKADEFLDDLAGGSGQR